MRKKANARKIWSDICANCKCHKEFNSLTTITIFQDTLKFIEQADNPVDKFSLATLAKDEEAIDSLYTSISLNEYQKNLISKLSETNNDLLLTLNPYILDPKFEFLKPIIDELVLDPLTQEKLLSLDEYEISILKRIAEYSFNYGVNPISVIEPIIDSIGCSSLSARNPSEKWLAIVDSIFKLLKDYESTNGKIDEKTINNVAVILKSGVFIPTKMDEIINYTDMVKKRIEKKVNSIRFNLKNFKESLVYCLFSMSLEEAIWFSESFNIGGLPKEYYTSPGVVELMALKMILNSNNIIKLKKVAKEFINNPDYEINSFNNSLIKENLLLLYAKEFNKCKPNFDEENLIGIKDGIKFYNSGENFYAIVKTLGAFSQEGKETKNYYVEWNDKRYKNHVNSVSLIRNDNLAFAEIDGEIHIKLGFLNFDEKMFLGGGISDLNSGIDSREMRVNINSDLYFPEEFINKTRSWHNELAYERKNYSESSVEFKKNPDFIVLDQELEDLSSLTPEEKKQYALLLDSSIKAAKDFGNIPILVINREKIAKNEIKVINTMLDNYIGNHDMDLLKNIIIKFNNNRNGCRGPQHKYIRENYFSNDYFQNLLNEIDNNILVEQRNEFNQFLLDEYERMRKCAYDNTTLDIPITPNNKNKNRGDLNESKRKR